MTFWKQWPMLLVILLIPILVWPGSQQTGTSSADGHGQSSIEFPKGLDSYQDQQEPNIIAKLRIRVQEVPFNIVASLLFLLAIIHTFLSSKFHNLAYKWRQEHERKISQGQAKKGSVHLPAELFHLLGEVEVIFGIWVLPLFFTIVYFFDFNTAVKYVGHQVNYTEPMFVVVIMILASTRPILKLSEMLVEKIANLLGGTLSAWWITILTLGPILGSFITEPAAMTISALLLAVKFYDLEPSNKIKYATLGLLFVNVSVGGTLTHFAAPPVLMVAHAWNWNLSHMFLYFGWEAVLGILLTNVIYYLLFKKELAQLENKFALMKMEAEIQHSYLQTEHIKEEFEELERIVSDELGFTRMWDDRCEQIKKTVRKKIFSQHLNKNLDMELFEKAFNKKFDKIRVQEMQKTLPALLPESQRPEFLDPNWDDRDEPVPAWIMIVHLLFMGWTVLNSHSPALFIGGLMFFLGFCRVTLPYQNRIQIQSPMLVGFFLAGLVIHGGLQGWWIAPVLGALKELPLMIGATLLTAFNDNAAITYLSTLVPNFSPVLKHAVVAGAVTGGGLTVIANAPNPAGQAILKKYFGDAVSPLGLAKAALLPTFIMFLSFWLLRTVPGT